MAPPEVVGAPSATSPCKSRDTKYTRRSGPVHKTCLFFTASLVVFVSAVVLRCAGAQPTATSQTAPTEQFDPSDRHPAERSVQIFGQEDVDPMALSADQLINSMFFEGNNEEAGNHKSTTSALPSVPELTHETQNRATLSRRRSTQTRRTTHSQSATAKKQQKYAGLMRMIPAGLAVAALAILAARYARGSKAEKDILQAVSENIPGAAENLAEVIERDSSALPESTSAAPIRARLWRSRNAILAAVASVVIPLLMYTLYNSQEMVKEVLSQISKHLNFSTDSDSKEALSQIVAHLETNFSTDSRSKEAAPQVFTQPKTNFSTDSHSTPSVPLKVIKDAIPEFSEMARVRNASRITRP